MDFTYFRNAVRVLLSETLSPFYDFRRRDSVFLVCDSFLVQEFNLVIFDLSIYRKLKYKNTFIFLVIPPRFLKDIVF